MAFKPYIIKAFVVLATILTANYIQSSKTPAPPVNVAQNTTASALARGKDAFLKYDFNTAAGLFRQYLAQNKSSEAVEWEHRAQNAANAFERVQKIVVIDSISMPREDFYKAIRLPLSAGSVGTPSDFKLSRVTDSDEISFLNEGKDYLITPEENEDGYLQLMEKRKLLDGSWETLEALKGEFNKDGNYAFPFLSADGQTLYFANDGEGSMGGLDLFVVQKEPITGECLQPLNLGMPFNSPYDDLMIAIDEENGIGWWATDRNAPGEDITIYIYILDEVRKNYSSDTPNLKSLAKMSNYKATWEEGKEGTYQKILNSLPK